MEGELSPSMTYPAGVPQFHNDYPNYSERIRLQPMGNTMNTLSEKKKSGPRRKDAGQALVELAISVMFLLLLVFGIIEFGRAMYIKNTLTNAARASVRVAVVTSGFTDRTYAAGSLSTRSTTDVVQQKLYDNIAPLLDSNQASATVDVIERNTPAQPNDTVTATVSIPFNTIVPGLLTMLRPNNNALILEGNASMRFE